MFEDAENTEAFDLPLTVDVLIGTRAAFENCILILFTRTAASEVDLCMLLHLITWVIGGVCIRLSWAGVDRCSCGQWEWRQAWLSGGIARLQVAKYVGCRWCERAVAGRSWGG